MAQLHTGELQPLRSAWHALNGTHSISTGGACQAASASPPTIASLSSSSLAPEPMGLEAVGTSCQQPQLAAQLSGVGPAPMQQGPVPTDAAPMQIPAAIKFDSSSTPAPATGPLAAVGTVALAGAAGAASLPLAHAGHGKRSAGHVAKPGPALIPPAPPSNYTRAGRRKCTTERNRDMVEYLQAQVGLPNSSSILLWRHHVIPCVRL